MSPAVLLSLVLLAPQDVYRFADFVQVTGNSLKARYDSALDQGRRGTTDEFWVAYRIPARDGLRVNVSNDNVNVGYSRTSDGIEFGANTRETQRVGLFLLIQRLNGAIERVRLLDLDEDFRVHDRKVYWLGEPSAEQSASLLAGLVEASPQKSSSSLLMAVSFHQSPFAANSLLRIARGSSSASVRKNAVFWLGQEVSRQAGEELEKLATSDPDVEVQKQVVFALSQRKNDEAIPSLLRIAKEHPSLAVRKQAIFWLGQKNDPRVLDVFEQMLKK